MNNGSDFNISSNISFFVLMPPPAESVNVWFHNKLYYLIRPTPLFHVETKIRIMGMDNVD